jgi:hypothetical protein
MQIAVENRVIENIQYLIPLQFIPSPILNRAKIASQITSVRQGQLQGDGPQWVSQAAAMM